MKGIIIAGAILVVAVLWFVISYNRLVRLQNRFENAWSQIDVQLKRRYDLIPNLVDTVKGYAAHERDTLDQVVRAREAGVAASGVGDQAQAENVITGALRQLFALAEAYPELKANQNFLALQDELAGTEDRIAYARQFYNDSVQNYDDLRRAFPSSIVAQIGGFQAQEYFEIEENSRNPVPVDFDQQET